MPALHPNDRSVLVTTALVMVGERVRETISDISAASSEQSAAASTSLSKEAGHLLQAVGVFHIEDR